MHLLVLGSQSAFRASLLRAANYQFETIPANLDEKAIRDDNPRELVKKLALAKADAVMDQLRKNGRKAFVITSDQVVVRLKDDQILEKPLDSSEQPSEDLARDYLMSYRNSPVETVTGLTVVNMYSGNAFTKVDNCTVYLSPFSEDELDLMVADPRTYEASGALPYGIEDSRASEIIDQHMIRMVGDRTSFIGLPMTLLRQSLGALGFVRQAVGA